MANIIVMALRIAAPIGKGAVDHVYLRSDDGKLVWPCFGRSTGGTPVAVLEDADLKAALEECPSNGVGSIKYGINGIDHQQANRILAAASTGGKQVVVPPTVRGVRLSYFMWGLYGRKGRAEMSPPRGSSRQLEDTIDSDESRFVASALEFQEEPDATAAKVLVASESQWQILIAQLASNPHLMRELDYRKFEELVAELLSREGLEVELTPQQKDGRRDILAYMNTDFGRHLYLVECKR